jgi:protocatechuate 3,4-dioxygenase beta subunit
MDLSTVAKAIPGTQPDFHYPPYLSSVRRSPRMPLVLLPETLTERTGPVFGRRLIREHDNDLTVQHQADPIGERILVHGRVLDEDGCPLRGALVEVWQANAARRYRHKVDNHDAPLDPNFSGRPTLIAQQGDNQASFYRWNVVLQGPDETVFVAW